MAMYFSACGYGKGSMRAQNTKAKLNESSRPDVESFQLKVGGFIGLSMDLDMPRTRTLIKMGANRSLQQDSGASQRMRSPFQEHEVVQEVRSKRWYKK